MKIEGPLVAAVFVERPNRFVTIIEIGGKKYRSHLPDPGRLKELLIPGVNLLVRPAPKNKIRSYILQIQIIQWELILPEKSLILFIHMYQIGCSSF